MFNDHLTLYITGAINEYEGILSRVNIGSFFTNAHQAEQFFLLFLSSERSVADAAKVDLGTLQDGILQLSSPTLKHTFPVAQRIFNRKLTELRRRYTSSLEEIVNIIGSTTQTTQFALQLY